jgi:hypothetical protein
MSEPSAHLPVYGDLAKRATVLKSVQHAMSIPCWKNISRRGFWRSKTITIIE